jgi:hypothetical protein
MAIYYTTNPSEFKLTDSVIIAEQDQPSSGKLASGPALTGIVGEFPWGPVDTLLEFSDGDALIKALVGGHATPEDYGGYRAIANKEFGGPLRVVRVGSSTDAKASRTLVETATDAVDLTAKYEGIVGNDITTLWTNDTANFDLVVTWGDIVETFEAVSFDAAGMAYITANSDLIDAALNVAAGGNPATDGSAVALTGGIDGTPADIDYTGSPSIASGLQVLRQMEDGGFVFVAEYTSAAVITALSGHMAVKLCNGGAQADASNVTDTNNTAAGLVSDERLRLFNHRFRQSINGTEFTVDATAFYAAIYSSIDPSESVAQKKWKGFLVPVIGLPSGVELTRPEWIAADAAGAIMAERNTDGGYKFHMDITSNTADGKTSSVRRRMHDLVNFETGGALENFANAKPTPSNRRAAKGAMDKRLGTLKGNEQIEEFTTEEVAKTGDSVTYKTKVKLFGELRFIINKTVVGENVVIEEVA